MAAVTGIVFNHHIVGTLSLRLAPTSVEWGYKLNTSTTPTYAGEVIQLLSINIDTLTISGRFGKEGVWGANQTSEGITPRDPVKEARDYKGGTGPFRIGLTQMTEYFRNYFAVAAQGHDADAQGHYDQHPMIITYAGALDTEEARWTAYPTSFPSYRRTNVDFAPEWQLKFEVEEPDYKIKTSSMTSELSRLRDAIGYVPYNVFSDPLGAQLDPRISGQSSVTNARLLLAQQANTKLSNDLIDLYSNDLPAYTPDDLNALIFASKATQMQQLYQQDVGSSLTLNDIINVAKGT